MSKWKRPKSKLTGKKWTKSAPAIESDEAKSERLMQLTLVWLQSCGWIGSICERRPFGKRHKTDFLGFADIVAVKIGTRKTAAIQVTTLTGVIERLQKIDQHPNSSIWYYPPCRSILVVGWHTEYTLSRRWDFQPDYSLSSSTARRISIPHLNSRDVGAKPLVYRQRME